MLKMTNHLGCFVVFLNRYPLRKDQFYSSSNVESFYISAYFEYSFEPVVRCLLAQENENVGHFRFLLTISSFTRPSSFLIIPYRRGM